VSKVFSAATLGKFEDASASIPLRQIDRAFEGASIRIGEDSGGGVGGSRRTHFRRYVAGVDQHDPQQQHLLGAALGALIAEVAASKEEFLVKAAERDGFFFADGVFRPAGRARGSFAVTRVEDLASIGERTKQLQLLANESPKDAVAGANDLVESVCRTVLRTLGEPAPGKRANLVDVAKATLDNLELVPAAVDDAKKRVALVRRCLEQLVAVAAALGEWKGLSSRHARLVVDAAGAFARFVAEPYVVTANDSLR
jgi:hypothetical protein